MTDMIRYGDVCGYDDAEVIDIDDGVLVIDLSNNEGSDDNADSQQQVV